MERAQLLKEARLKKRLTREQAAERLGVAPSTVKRWENGISTPQPINLHSIAEVYGLTPQEVGLYEFPQSKETSVATQNAAAFEDEEEEDAITSFRKQDITSRLMHIVWNWLLSCYHARYQELQTLVALELEGYSRMHPDNINRRNALRRMALLAIDLCALSVYQPVIKRPVEEILTYCASGIVACWYLRKGKELAFVDDAISKYIPTLKELVKSAPEPQRKSAADLLAQSLLLKATCVEQLNGNYAASLQYRKQAETYSEQTGNLALSIAAMRAQAVSYNGANNWEQAMHISAKAKNMTEVTEAEEVSLTLQSYVHAGLAYYLARTGSKYKQDALMSTGKAQTAFDAAMANKETAPIWIGYDEGNLLLNSGLAYYHLGMSQKAIDSFARIGDLKDSHETYRVESFIDQAMAEVNREDRPPDMDFCIDLWQQGIQGAVTLHSEEKFTLAIQVYAMMRVVWRGEQRIKNLRDYIKHW